MAGNIFISYRRDDTAAWAGRLHLALQKHFRPAQLFMDVDNIKPGADFVKALDDQIAKCDVLLAVIGKDWTKARKETGERRLDDPDDFVRIEIESALKRDIRVVPVLVDNAGMPKAADLPDAMKALTRRQAVTVTHARFGSEIDGLAKSLGDVFATGPNWQANWSGFQAEVAKMGLNARTLEAGTRAAKKAGWAVAWFYGVLLVLALIGALAIAIGEGAGLNKDTASAIGGWVILLAGIAWWRWRKTKT
jgi:hypothetical protein